MICVVIPGPTEEKIEAQLSEAVKDADLIELRLDLFQTINRDFLKNILNQFSIPFIFTLKGKGVVFSQIQALAQLKPAYLDLDSQTPAEWLLEIRETYPQVRLILSYHDYNKMPANLSTIYQEVLNPSAYLYKFALTADSTLDALKLFLWTKNKDPRILAICMGNKGEISRLLNPILGKNFTYASLSSDLKTAEGQLTVGELNDFYHYRRLNRQTQIFGLIGTSLESSLSHITHNHYFQQIGLNAIYVKMEIQIEELDEFFKLIKNLNFKGLSVTMPLKEAIIPYLDWVDPEVVRIGACNTISCHDGKLLGYNTDSLGALTALDQCTSVKGQKVLILGAGGAAKAIAYGVYHRGAQVTILNRNRKRAEEIAHELNCQADDLDKIERYVQQGYDVLINCTPLQLPIESTHILPHSLIMDINTKSVNTPFLNAAKEKKCQIIYGYEMFIAQAIGQFRHWLGDLLDQKECYTIIKNRIQKVLLKE